MATMTTTAPAPTRRETPRRATRTVTPAVDIYETDTAFILLADMPGVGPGGLEVVAEREQLIVRGRVERPTTEPDYQEFELADYYRTFVLTEDLDVERIGATLKDGVLRVDIPKSPRVVPKKIPVRAE
jgi:HSP20 family molecular chaperone IbpA